MSHHRFLGPLVLMTALALTAPAGAADKDQVRKAVERGVAYLQQIQDRNGSWPVLPTGATTGATALIGLALLECDVPATDPAIEAAAKFLRNHWAEVDDSHATYTLALAVLFFDRLGEPEDTPIIQALGARLLGGQNADGAWSYACPPLDKQDLRQLQSLIQRRVELKAKGELPKLKAADAGRRPALPPEVQRLVTRMRNSGPRRVARLDMRKGMAGDNSNTQFAILGLWVARRHGVPADKALARAATHFRAIQHANGGWGYPAEKNQMGFGITTGSMTCAGLLGLALGLGNAQESVLRAETRLPSAHASPKKAADPLKDRAVRDGLAALARVVGQPLDDVAIGAATGLGDRYYLLWSVERVAVAYGLAHIGTKDWYDWGAELLLSGQQMDGAWRGKFTSGVDTSFALLFLRRANLSQDLTAYLKGTPSVRAVLKAGLGEEGAKVPDETVKEAAAKGPSPAPEKTIKPSADKPAGAIHAKAAPTPPAADAEAVRLGAALVKASGPPQERLLDQLKRGKGTAYTEALAGAIGHLHGAVKHKARDALAERLARMTEPTLRNKLRDRAPEVRRAAALAAAMKEDKRLVPDLITLLGDQEATVARAAHAALKEMTRQDLGPPAAWKEWWAKQNAK
jgi:hypothetical protein